MKKSLIFLFGLGFLSTSFVGYTFAHYAVYDKADPFGGRITTKVPTREVYLKAGVWDVNDPVYFAHCYGGADDYDVQLTACESAGFYKFTVQMNYHNVVFVRDPTSTVTIDWDNLWNKTSDLTFDLTKDTYEITDWGSNKISVGQWINHSHDSKSSITTLTPATASECAVKKQTNYCGVCGEILSETTFIDHEHLTEHAALAATCTTAGNTHYYSCDHCGKYFSDSAAENEIVDHTSVTIAATGHSFTNHYGHDATNHWLICDHDCGSTDTPEAHTFENGVCTVCGYVQGHTHNYVNHPAVAATCTTVGNSQYYTCSGCDLIFDSNYEEIDSIPTIAVLGHNYIDHICTRCGDVESGYTKLTFEITYSAGYGNEIAVLGSYNGWNMSSSSFLHLSWTDNDIWTGSLVLPNGNYEFKSIHICNDNGGKAFWENSSNHQKTLTGGNDVLSYTASYNYNDQANIT